MILLIKLYLSFLAIGTMAFGGGYAMLPFVKDVLVNYNHWIAPDQFTSYIGLCQLAPGPLTVNLTYYIGFKLAGIPGGIFAILGLITTTFILVSVAFKAFSKFKNSILWKAYIKGMKPALVGLLVSALIMVSQTAYLHKSFNDTWHTVLMTIISGALLFSKKIHPVYIIFIVAILGIILKFTHIFNL